MIIKDVLMLIVLVLAIIIDKFWDNSTMKRGGYQRKVHNGNRDAANRTKETQEKYNALMLKYKNEIHKPIITFDDIPDRFEYVSGAKFPKPSAHIGQRKLFVNEMQFLTGLASPLIVYAGAAPSNHTGFLSDLFPEAKFLLVDPNKFDIFGANPVYLPIVSGVQQWTDVLNTMGDERIYVINGYFTDDLARALATREFYFISDIRTNIYDNKEPDTLDIVWNLAQQFNWIKLSNPIKSMLKFRHPFYSDKIGDKALQQPYADTFKTAREFGVDFVANANNKKLTYFAGTINLQPWAGISSTETRLVTDGREIISHDLKSYEDALYYYNSIERCFVKHENVNANRELGFCHCNDCAIENTVLTNYIAAHGNKYTVLDLVQKLSEITHRNLFRDGHGVLF